MLATMKKLWGLLRVLIVEDDEFKQRRLEQVVRTFQPTAEVRSERSVNSGLRGIIDFHPDLILLDMSLTTFDVGPREPGGDLRTLGASRYFGKWSASKL